jgi:hypothetical protein
MKKSVFAIIMAGSLGVATLANAQTVVPGTVTTEDVAATQVDFVTVGATMPYSTDASQADLEAWKTDAAALGLSVENVTATTTWYVNAAEKATGSELRLKWDVTPGSFAVEARTQINVGETVSCAPATVSKTVYVLPEPSVAFTGGSDAILACDATSHDLSYAVKGIGNKKVTYTVTKKPLGADAVTGSSENVSKGTAEVESFFVEATTSYATAAALYTGEGTAGTLRISNLEAGYIYTVTVTGVSDQISRKSNVTVAPANLKANFAVVPSPTGTKINHIKNLDVE